MRIREYRGRKHFKRCVTGQLGMKSCAKMGKVEFLAVSASHMQNKVRMRAGLVAKALDHL